MTFGDGKKIFMRIRTGLRRKMIGLLYKSHRKKFLLLVTFAEKRSKMAREMERMRERERRAPNPTNHGSS